MSIGTTLSLSFQIEHRSYVDALHAVLTGAGLYEGSKYMLGGMTGLLSKFVIHKELSRSSVTAYGNLGEEHGNALLRIGIESNQFAWHTRQRTFELAQQESIRHIQHSIDRGIGVVYWKPEFAVITGYDDEDEVFFYLDGYSKEQQVLLYRNFGIIDNPTPFWYYQTIIGAVDMPYQEIYRESLITAVTDWDTPHRTLPDLDFAAGCKAYDYMIAALSSQQYHPHGSAYTISSYAGIKRDMMKYLASIQEEAGISAEVVQLYQLVDEAFQVMKATVQNGTGHELCIQSDHVPQLIEQAHLAMEHERAAIEILRTEIGYEEVMRSRSNSLHWGSAAPR
ncbi:hypothetical protein [Paenibacillus sp. NAIST15-1]|uniref:hypothetical protein n=1 Tax=Paenibacillus sp. NAIST15-1 TaxID=1605994 RepID=UPI00086CB95C|nr:hypothetical protein [Paenibacillus sp. NAIST15-1]GAV14666.1 hypothetical protein PBN151_4644 [Paenibacillus sp. NAIST15-1]